MTCCITLDNCMRWFPLSRTKATYPEGWLIFDDLGAFCMEKKKVKCLLEEKLLKFANGNLACVFLQIFSMIVCPKISCLTYQFIILVFSCTRSSDRLSPSSYG